MLRFGLIVIAAVLIADQVSKHILLGAMEPPRLIVVTGFFNIVLVWNKGVSFGLFNQGGSASLWILSALALTIAAALTIWLARTDKRLVGWSLALIIGGALGNVVDRVRFGAVIDFLDFHVAGWHWPAFNVADAAITIGVVLLLFENLFGRAESPK